MRSELDGAQLALERTERNLMSARLVNNRTSRDLERSQGRMRNAELEHSSRRKMLERDLDKERELVALKEHSGASCGEPLCGANAGDDRAQGA